MICEECQKKYPDAWEVKGIVNGKELIFCTKKCRDKYIKAHKR
jgi:hypothetical protein